MNIDFLNYQLFYYPFLRLTTGTTGHEKVYQERIDECTNKSLHN